MITLEKKNTIITLHKQGHAIKTIVKLTGIARNTVRSYIREYEKLQEQILITDNKAQLVLLQEALTKKPERKKSQRVKKAFNPDVEKRFLELIKLDEERDQILGCNKQKMTATKLWKQLKREGYQVSESTTRKYYNAYMNKAKECFIKQCYEYGQRAEYDFHQIKVLIGGEVKIYHQATISLPRSNYIFGILYKNENTPVVLDSIIKFFNHCNGVVNEMVFDNMSPVVKRLIINGEKTYTDAILKLSNYYGFKITTCNVAKGNEKGHVENSGKLVRNDLFSLNYKFETEEELYDYYHKELKKYNSNSIKEFEEEKKHLLTKPLHDYIVCTFGTAVVSSYSLITVDNNYYSVPDKYVGKTLIINKFDDDLMVYYKDHLICEHKIKKGFKEYSINIHHYVNTFLKKPGALKNSLALKQAPEELSKIFYNNYNMNAKKFIEDLSTNIVNINNNVQFKENNTVEATSIAQLNNITNLLN